MLDHRRSPSPVVAARRSRWPSSAALLLELVACTIALVGLIQGRDWWLALMGTAVVLLAVPAVLRALGVRPWAASALDVVAFAILVQIFFGLANVPSLLSRAALAIQNQRTPAEPLPELIFFIVLFGGVLTIVIDALAISLRAPAATGLVIGGVMVVPALLHADGLSLVALCAGAAAWFVVLWVDGRERHESRGSGAAAAGVAASATVIALVVAATAPGFLEQGRIAPAGPVTLGNTVNPLIDLGADLRRPTPVDVLRYTTAASTPEYLQLTTLDTMRGTNWTHTRGPLEQLRRGNELGAVPGFDAAAGYSAKSVSTVVYVQNLRSTWLPSPYPATKVSGALSVQTYEAGDLTMYSQRGNLGGQVYTTTSLDLEPTRAQLAEQGPYDSSDFGEAQADLDLPGDVPPIITETANQIASSAGGVSELDMAIAIQDFFQSSASGFSYSTNSPDTLDGASLDVIAQFLKVREGYCVHFASAMAVIARVLGIPSRIAIGYLPGSPVGSQGKKTTYQVDSSDLHAWPQLYFPGVGWLNFEPTVSRGALPAYTQAATQDSSQQGQLGTESVPTASAKPKQLPTDTPLVPGQAAGSPAQTAASATGRYGIGALVVLAVLALPALARLLRRRRRLSRLRRPGTPPGDAWNEVRDTARDLGFATWPTETPRAFAERLRSDWLPDAAQQRDLEEILEQVELARFGPPRSDAQGAALADSTARVTAAMRDSRHWTTRLIATWAPRSLFTAQGLRTATYDRRL